MYKRNKKTNTNPCCSASRPYLILFHCLGEVSVFPSSIHTVELFAQGIVSPGFPKIKWHLSIYRWKSCGDNLARKLKSRLYATGYRYLCAT